ncbi:LexA family protein [Methylobacterium tarhaniae]|uniref:LexA family protein n=1 Tax=Methylobacterium tarhaniae TaxID=1187852 RepID=UPI003D04E5B9
MTRGRCERVGLTPKQRRLLTFIERYVAASDGVSPSFDEMREGLGLRSKSGIGRLLEGLEERGHIRRLSNLARGIELTAQPASLDLSALTQARIRGLASRAGTTPNAFLSAVLDAHGDRP